MANRSLSVDVTEKCNFGCVYCYKGEKSNESMSMSTFENTLDNLWDWLTEYGDLSLFFMGGEPFCDYGRLQEIVEFARDRAVSESKNFKWSATSNLSMVSPQMIDFVKNTNGYVHCSIDGVPAAQNINRPLLDGSPTSDIIMKNLVALDSITKSVRVTITPLSVPYLYDSIKYLGENGFNGVAAFPAIGNIGWNKETLKIYRDQINKIANERFGELGFLKAIRPVDDYVCFKTWPERFDSHASRCGACRNTISVGIDGRLWPCHRFNGLDGEWQIHTLDQMEEVRNALTTRNTKCLECKLEPICKGGCWAEALANSGDVHRPHEDHCDLASSMYDGVEDSDTEATEEIWEDEVAISGEGSCVFRDVCTFCDCESDDDNDDCDSDRSFCARDMDTCSGCDESHSCSGIGCGLGGMGRGY